MSQTNVDALWLWVPVDVQLPAPEVPVLVAFRNYLGKYFWARAIWIPRFHKLYEFDYEGDDLDYREEDGEGFWPEGWYEWNNYEEMHWRMDVDVTHWSHVALPGIDEAQTTD